MVKIMEEWKKSVLIGVILIILAIAFAIARKEFNIWIILILILAVVDIIFGLMRKKMNKSENLEFSIKNEFCWAFHESAQFIFFFIYIEFQVTARQVKQHFTVE